MMKEKLKAAFERLQKTQITATMDNLEAVLLTLYDIRDVYNELKEDDRDGRGPEADPERRDGD